MEKQDCPFRLPVMMAVSGGLHGMAGYKITFCPTHAAAFEMRKAIQSHILNMDELLTPEVWRSLQPQVRGAAIAGYVRTLEQALALCREEADHARKD